MASLYELTGEYLRLASMIEDATDRDDPAFAEAVAQLTELDDAIECKGECYARIIKNLQSDINGLKGEIDRLSNIKRAREAAVDRLKAAMLDAMQTTGKDKLPTTIGKWSVQHNPMSVTVLDPTKVPERFLKYAEPVVNKAAMIAEHKLTGEEFEGVEFTQTEGVRFR